MTGGALLGLSLPLLLFLLAPGYLGLRGYLKSSFQLDSLSRTDKLILSLIGGVGSLGTMLLLNRFGVLSSVVDYWYSLWTPQAWEPNLGHQIEDAVTLDSIGSFTGLSLFGFLVGQSVIAYIGGYVYGIHRHVISDEIPKSKEDIEQPWERAVKDSVIKGEITVITKQGEKIKGNLYRVGSPSKNYDILLSGAEKIIEGGDNESIGVAYHHHRDISRVEFDVPGIDPEKEFNNTYDAKLAQVYSRIIIIVKRYWARAKMKIQDERARINSLYWRIQARLFASEYLDTDTVEEKIKEGSMIGSRLYNKIDNHE